MTPLHEVLVVEDDDDVRDALVETLQDLGYSTTSARNGHDAMQLLREGVERPRLIILDLMMPVMDGASFRIEQLTIPELADIPVVITSAYRDITRFLNGATVQDVLMKPLSRKDLLRVAEHYCRPPAPAGV